MIRKSKTGKVALKIENKANQKLLLLSTTYKWEGQSFPFIEEQYSFGEETIVVGSYMSSEDPDFEKFLFAVMRESQPPKWIKNNLLKIKKKIRDEIKHRVKLREKLTREQKEAIGLFFQDIAYFDRDESDDYFDLELDRSSMFFLRALLATPNYEAFVRQGIRKRKGILSKYG